MAEHTEDSNLQHLWDIKIVKVHVLTGTRMKRMKFLDMSVTYPKTVYEPLQCHIRNIWFIIRNSDPFFFFMNLVFRQDQ